MANDTIDHLADRIAALEAALAAHETRVDQFIDRHRADVRALEQKLAEFNHGRFVDTRNLEHFAHGELLQIKKELAGLVSADVHFQNLAAVRHRELSHTIRALETTVQTIRKPAASH